MALLEVGDVRGRLKLDATDPDDDTVASLIAAAQASIESQIGYLEPRAVTEVVYRAGPGSLMVSRWPVISLTSLTTVGDSPQPVDTTTARLDAAGVIRWSGGYIPVYAEAYTVAYQAGRQELSDDLLLALYEQVRHLLRTIKLGARSRGQSDAEKVPGYSMPNLVMGLIAPYKVPGIS